MKKKQTLEKWTSGTDQHLLVHKKNKDCTKYHCVIHNPSKHVMKDFKTFWRNDRGLMERICPHGIGHPDPDDIAFKKRIFGKRYSNSEEVHGCDGCCGE